MTQADQKEPFKKLGGNEAKPQKIQDHWCLKGPYSSYALVVAAEADCLFHQFLIELPDF